jgi:hypothetical protein
MGSEKISKNKQSRIYFVKKNESPILALKEKKENLRLTFGSLIYHQIYSHYQKLWLTKSNYSTILE